MKKKARVAIIMGSDTDLPVMKEAVEALKHFGVSYEVAIVSAHRTPQEMTKFARGAARRKIQVIIAGAGGAAHLPGMVAAQTEIPVIGVPVPVGPMRGEDALLSIVQMPRGVPVATVAIGNAYNAGLLAVQILASGGPRPDPKLMKAMAQYRAQLRKAVLKKRLPVL